MIKTVLASNRMTKQQKRFPVAEIGDGWFEVVLPPWFCPHPRAGIQGSWQLTFTRTKTGETVWRNG